MGFLAEWEVSVAAKRISKYVNCLGNFTPNKRKIDFWCSKQNCHTEIGFRDTGVCRKRLGNFISGDCFIQTI